jgi:hypothetical protein
MKLRRIVGAVVFGISAGPAFAGTVDCTNYLGSFTTSTGTTATSCAGFFDGNVLDNSSTTQNPDVQTQTSALASLGFTFTDFNDYTKVDLASDATVLSFGTPLYGDTIIGIHFGNSSAVGNSTGFFEFNFTQPTSSINLGITAPSDAVLYTTASAVPEPASWALMLLGFAGIGFALRRTRTRRPGRLLQIA